MRSVGFRSYSGPHFPAFRLNTERYSASLRIQRYVVSLRVPSECGEMRARITLNTDIFYAVTGFNYGIVKFFLP